MYVFFFFYDKKQIVINNNIFLFIYYIIELIYKIMQVPKYFYKKPKFLFIFLFKQHKKYKLYIRNLCDNYT